MQTLAETTHFATHLQLQAELRPDAVAFEFTGTAAGEPLSFADLHRRALACASAWRADLQPGDRVLLCLPAGAEFMVALFGCFYAGVVAVPVPPPLAAAPGPGRAWFRTILADADPRALIWSPAVADLLGPVELGDLRALTLDSSNSSFRIPAYPSDALAILLYTSGSTGAPKGVELRHESLLHNMRAFARACGRSADDRIHTWLPNVHIAGLYTRLLGVFLGGTTSIATPADFLQSPLEWLRTISSRRATISAAPNFAYDLTWQAAEGQALDGLDLSCWAMAVTGGEVVRPATYERFVQRFGPCGFAPAAFHPYYGLTETLCTTIPQGQAAPELVGVDRDALRDNRVVLSEAANALTLVGNGSPLGAGVVAIVDPETRRRCPAGTIGEIWTADRSNTRGYWRRPELSAEVCHARIEGDDDTIYFRTGDLGFVHDGALFVTGRRKELIIIHGKNYYPQDIEATVLDCLGASACAAFCVDDGRGERLAIAVECGARAPDELRTLASALRAAVHARHGLSVHRLALLTDARLPRTSTQKIQRAACRELLERGAWDSSLGEVVELEAPSAIRLDPARPEGWAAAIEAFLQAEIARHSELGSTEVSLDRSLAEHGLDSVAIVELALAVREFCAPVVAVRIADVHPGVSLAELAATLSSSRNEDFDFDFDADLRLLDPILAEPEASTGSGDAILLTGATGFLGRYLLHALLRASDRPVLCLVRAADADAARRRVEQALASGPGDAEALGARVIALPGDLLAPRLGLSDADHQMLRERVGAVVHNAASVDFVAPYARLRASNVLPTVELIRLCRRAGAHLHYVSTTAVFNSPERARLERLREDDRLAEPRLIHSGYAQSKWVSEELLRRASAAGLAVSVYRPAQITGDRTSGFWNTDDFLTRFIKGCLQLGHYPDVDVDVDMVPVDYVAQAIAELARAAIPGHYNLGNPRAIAVHRLFAWVRAAGYACSPEPLPRWLERLAQTRGRSRNALLALLPFLDARPRPDAPTILELLDGEGPDKLDMTNTARGLLAAGLEPPTVDEALVRRYTDHFVASGFFADLDR